MLYLLRSRWLLPGLLLVLFCRLSIAETMLPDTLRPEGGGNKIIFDAAGSPYIFDSLVSLLPDDTLVIRPGAEILARGTNRIDVLGVLLAEGRADSMITFRQDPSDSLNWLGIYFPRDLTDSTRIVSRLSFAHISDCLFGLVNRRMHSEELDANLVVDRCLFTSTNLAILTLRTFDTSMPMRTRITNCVFDRSTSTDVYISHAETWVRNCVFIPPDDRDAHIGVAIRDPLDGMDFDEYIDYNCFSPRLNNPDNSHWVEYVLWANTGDAVYTRHPLSENSMYADPLFEEDSFYLPQESSPLVDAGDPDILDPDLTVSDIGIFWNVADPVPFSFQTGPGSVDWVLGYPLVKQLGFDGYPPPQLEIDGPEGLEIRQVSRALLELVWPQEQQQAGVFSVEISGYNTIGDESFADTLLTSLDLEVNLPPTLLSFTPCPDADCAGQSEILVDQLASGDTLHLMLELEDPNSERLGEDQPWNYTVMLDGQLFESISGESSYQFDMLLDTTNVELGFVIDDGEQSTSLDVQIEPRFMVLSGEVSGTFGSETGSVFLSGGVRVPVGETLNLEPGTRLICGMNDAEDDWMLEVEGSIVLAGTEAEPLEFRSLSDYSLLFDERPRFMRIWPGASISELSHVEFSNMGVALQLEYLDGAESFQLDNCSFVNCRVGALAIGSDVDIRNCRIEHPQDLTLRGSYGLYLAACTGQVGNNLFLNPAVGIECVDSEVEIANNSFLMVKYPDANGNLVWPTFQQLGVGRIHSLNSVLDVRNNLFQWRLRSTSSSIDSVSGEYMQYAIWLDDSSLVSTGYNWYDCLNGYLEVEEDLVNVSRALAVNDSLRLLVHHVAGIGEDSLYDADADYTLFSNSPLIDAGDPDLAWLDIDNSTNDIGWTGGPNALEHEYTPAGLREEQPGSLAELPSGFNLRAPWPNPFNPTTTLTVELIQAGELDLRIYNILGQEVAVLAEDHVDSGVYHFRFDASHLASGTYIARLQQGEHSHSVKMLLLR